MNKIFYLGRHIHITHDNKHNIINAIDEIKHLQGNLIQIFVSSPINRINPNINYYKNNGLFIKKHLHVNNIKIIIHGPYIINLGRKLNIHSWQIKRIIKELIVSDYINSIGVILHVGCSLQLSVNEAIENMYNNINIIINVMKKQKIKSKLILENKSGQGTELLYNIDDFIDFYKRFTNKKYFKVCIDTCHLFAAGNNISNKENIINLFYKINKFINFKNISLIHLNDSVYDFNSRKDRHANLFNGFINNSLRHFIKLAYIYKIPLLLETPTNNDLYKHEIIQIKKILNI